MDYNRNQFEANIFGTNSAGQLMNNGRPGKLHPALSTAKDYIEKCIGQGMSPEQFLKEYAIKNELLLYNPDKKRASEASCKLRTELGIAFDLFRICPELMKSEECKKVMDIVYKGDPEKVSRLLKVIPNGKNKLISDCKVLRDKINQLEQLISKDREGKKGEYEKLKRDYEQKLETIKPIEDRIDEEGR